jgi:peptidoglycan/LPS O-acetylase OafA/YrhL
LWKGMRWAWTTTLILSVIGHHISYYYIDQTSKAFFGK